MALQLPNVLALEQQQNTTCAALHDICDINKAANN